MTNYPGASFQDPQILSGLKLIRLMDVKSRYTLKTLPVILAYAGFCV